MIKLANTSHGPHKRVGVKPIKKDLVMVTTEHVISHPFTH